MIIGQLNFSLVQILKSETKNPRNRIWKEHQCGSNIMIIKPESWGIPCCLPEQ